MRDAYGIPLAPRGRKVLENLDWLDAQSSNGDEDSNYDERYGRLTVALNDLVELYRSRHSSGAPSIEDFVFAARRLVLEGHDPTKVTLSAMGSIAMYLNKDLCRWQDKVARDSSDASHWWESP